MKTSKNSHPLAAAMTRALSRSPPVGRNQSGDRHLSRDCQQPLECSAVRRIFSTQSSGEKPRSAFQPSPQIVAIEQENVETALEKLALDLAGQGGFAGARQPGGPHHAAIADRRAASAARVVKCPSLAKILFCSLITGCRWTERKSRRAAVQAAPPGRANFLLKRGRMRSISPRVARQARRLLRSDNPNHYYNALYLRSFCA